MRAICEREGKTDIKSDIQAIDLPERKTMKIEMENGITVTVKQEEKFKNIPVNSVFVLKNDKKDIPGVWVKTPFADMYLFSNRINECGEFCNAVCINADSNIYMQCKPNTACLVLDMEGIFGKYGR